MRKLNEKEFNNKAEQEEEIIEVELIVWICTCKKNPRLETSKAVIGVMCNCGKRMKKEL